MTFTGPSFTAREAEASGWFAICMIFGCSLTK
jgi:hypothetical protein